MKTLFQAALGADLPVFVSSDFVSIDSGDPWYDRILEGIRKTQAVVSLLSPTSIDRRWINFEAGLGVGQDCRVIPVVWRGQSKGGIGMPLGRHHARDLAEGEDIRALLKSLAAICGVSLTEAPIPDFIQDLPRIEESTPASDLEVTAFRSGMAICLAIKNVGNRPLDMIDAELLVPAQLGPSLHAFSPVRELHQITENGMRWTGYRLTTIPSTIAHLGVEPLRKSLAASMGEVPLTGINIALARIPSAEEEALPIRYRVSSQQRDIGPIIVPIGELPERA